MSKRKLPCFNVINFNINTKQFENYDVIPYLYNQYITRKKDRRPRTFDELKAFILSTSMYQWWCRCQYEIILSDWPCQQISKKIDVHQQVEMNIDIITDILYNVINKNVRNK